MRNLLIVISLSICSLTIHGQNDIEQLLNEALETIQLGDTTKAVEMWEEVLKTEPKNYRALSNLAIARCDLYYYSDSAEQAARTALKNLIRAYPDSSEGYCETGRLERYLGNFRKSARAYSKSEHAHAVVDREWSLFLARFTRRKKHLINLVSSARSGSTLATEYVTVYDMQGILDLAQAYEATEESSDDFSSNNFLNHCSGLSWHIQDHREAVDWLNRHVGELEEEVSQDILWCIEILQLVELSVLLEELPSRNADRNDIEATMENIAASVRESLASMDQAQLYYFSMEELGTCLNFIERVLFDL